MRNVLTRTEARLIKGVGEVEGSTCLHRALAEVGNERTCEASSKPLYPGVQSRPAIAARRLECRHDSCQLLHTGLGPYCSGAAYPTALALRAALSVHTVLLNPPLAVGAGGAWLIADVGQVYSTTGARAAHTVGTGAA